MTLFVDGEPLDVDQLNELASDINKVKSDLSSLTTRYNSNNKVIDNIVSIIETGSQEVKTAEGKVTPIQIPRNAFLNTDPNPSVQVTIGNATENVSFSINQVTKTGFNITFHSKSKQTVMVYWMAVVQRKIS